MFWDGVPPSLSVNALNAYDPTTYAPPVDQPSSLSMPPLKSKLAVG